MKNFGNLMKQAQEMQSRMQELQERAAGVEVTGNAGGGMVTVTLNGKGEARRVRIDPDLFSADDIEVVEDLMVTAINDARNKVEEHMQEEMSKLTGGISLPPDFKLPF